MVAGCPSALVSVRGGDHPEAGEQENNRDSQEQRTDHDQDLLEQAEAALMAQQSQP
jgi:hypothetical protein